MYQASLHFVCRKKDQEFLAGVCSVLPDDLAHLTMANSNEINTTCECRHTLVLSSDEDVHEIRDNSNNVPDIHEIDEEESEPEETTILEQPSPASHQVNDKVTPETKDDDESAYTGESFYSDESCDESEITNVTLESLKSLSLLHSADPQHSSNESEEVGINEWKDDFENESYSLNDRPSRATTASGFAKPKRCRRWNMSFTDEEMRKIGRENELLLRKIMAQQRPRHKIVDERVQSRVSSSAINRRKMQKKIEDDNMVR